MVKTERLFYNYTSPAPFEAAILELRPSGDGVAVILDKTIFYPDGGGQPGDRGSINSVSLLDVREKDGEILHLVSAPNPESPLADARKLKPGKAELVLDTRRRRDLTALHTGQHILSATLLRMIGAPTVSMHLGDESYTIDVDTPEMNDELITSVEDAVANVIEENRPVIVHLCPPEDINIFSLRKVPPQGEEVIRVVEIEGCDIIACCGTHVKTTAEIGLFRILAVEKYKGMTRIYFSAGRRLLLESRLLRQNAVTVSRAISVPVNEIGKGLLEFLEKNTQMEKRLKALEEKAIHEKAEALLQNAAFLSGAANAFKPAGPELPVIVVESYPDESIDEVLSIGKIAQKQSQAAFILASEQDCKFIAIAAKGFDIKSLIKDTFDAHGGKGGGSASFFQGSFATKEALKAFLGKVNFST
ncbi:MAG: alanyl-tRNA editing protein [Treponema sp.]|jgi:alanyl-tRNA synthetase|nr:alanyl-tRNA editing protein [Treponema sp.]